MTKTQTWSLWTDEPPAEHRVKSAEKGLGRIIRWYANNELIAEKKSSDGRTVVKPHDDSYGFISVKHTSMGSPREALWYPSGSDELGAHAGTGGTAFIPEAGSKAAEHERKLREMPTRYTIERTAIAAGGVLVPLLLGSIALGWLIPTIPWPDIEIPELPIPDLPSIPWPDISLPDLAFPDLPDWLSYVIPVIVAFVIARNEIRKQRRKHRTADRDGCPDQTDEHPRR